MEKKPFLRIFITILFFLIPIFSITSCSSLMGLVQPTPTLPYPLVGTVDHHSTKTNTSPPPTATSTHEPTSTPTITTTPTLKPSTTPTITATKPTATVTATYLPAWRAPPLKNMQITWNDVAEYYEKTNTPLGTRYIDDFFKKSDTNIFDASIEVSNSCLFDCSKQVWATSSVPEIGFDDKEFLYFRRVVIFMYRSENEHTAGNLAENLYEEFAPFEFEWEANDYKYLDPPEGNTRAAVAQIEDHEGFINILTTSRGHIAFLVISYVPPFSDDGLTELEIAIHFANIQLDKLRQAAVIP